MYIKFQLSESDLSMFIHLFPYIVFKFYKPKGTISQSFFKSEVF